MEDAESDDPTADYGSRRTGGLDLVSSAMPLMSTTSPLASPLRDPLGNGYDDDDNWMYADPPELTRRERRRGSAGESLHVCRALKRQQQQRVAVHFFV